MTHNLINPNDPDDRDKQVHRVVLDVIVAPGADEPKLWNWNTLIGERTSLVSSNLLHGAVSAQAQEMLDLAIELDSNLREILQEHDDLQHRHRVAIDLHGKLDRLADDIVKVATDHPALADDLEAARDLVTTTVNGLLTGVFGLEPKS